MLSMQTKKNLAPRARVAKSALVALLVFALAASWSGCGSPVVRGSDNDSVNEANAVRLGEVCSSEQAAMPPLKPWCSHTAGLATISAKLKPWVSVVHTELLGVQADGLPLSSVNNEWGIRTLHPPKKEALCGKNMHLVCGGINNGGSTRYSGKENTRCHMDQEPLCKALEESFTLVDTHLRQKSRATIQQVEVGMRNESEWEHCHKNDRNLTYIRRCVAELKQRVAARDRRFRSDMVGSIVGHKWSEQEKLCERLTTFNWQRWKDTIRRIKAATEDSDGENTDDLDTLEHVYNKHVLGQSWDGPQRVTFESVQEALNKWKEFSETIQDRCDSEEYRIVSQQLHDAFESEETHSES